MRRFASIAVLAGAATIGGLYWFWTGRGSDGGGAESRDKLEPAVLRTTGPLVQVGSNCTIGGRVLGDDGAAPAAMAIVVLERSESVEGLAASVQEADGPITTVTDETGSWRVTGIPDGPYTVSAALPGHIPEALEKVECEASVRLELQPGGIPLSGHVTDVGGGPIAGVTVIAVGDDGSAAAITDSQGYYVIHLKEAGYRVRAWSPDYVEAHQWVQISAARTLDFELIPSGTIRGRVLSREDLAPVADAVILVDGGFGASEYVGRGSSAKTVSNQDGVFELRGLSSGALRLSAVTRNLSSREPTVVEMGIAEQVDGIEILLDPAFAIRGRVVRKDNPTVGVEGMNVTAGVAGDGFMAMIPIVSGGSRALEPTNSDGAFEIVGLQPNSYKLSAMGEAAIPAVAQEALELADRDIEDALVEVEIGVSVSGRVEPAGEASISLEKDGDVGLLDFFSGSMFATIGDEDTDEQGHFTLQQIPDGAYVVTARSEFGSQGSAKTVVEGKDVRGLVIELEARGSVAGVVIDSAGKPVEGMRVLAGLDDDSDDDLPDFRKIFRGQGRAESAADGSFEIRGLDDGAYRVFAARGFIGLNQPLPKDAVRVEIVNNGHIDGLVLKVDAADGEIRGVVYSEDQSPLADAWVSINRKREDSRLIKEVKEEGKEAGVEEDPNDRLRAYRYGRSQKPVLTGPDGRFTFRDLEEGQYMVTANAATGSGRGRVLDVNLGDDVVVVVRQLGSITGVVTQSGAPQEIYDLSLEGPGQAKRHVIAEDGRYRVDRLEAGTYKARVRTEAGTASETLEIKSGELSEQDFEIAGWASVRGQLLDVETEEPLSGMLVMAHSDGGAADAALSALLSGKPPRTDAQGKFRIDRLVAGKVRVGFMNSGILTSFSGKSSQTVGYSQFVLEAEEELDIGVVYGVAPKEIADDKCGSLGLETKVAPRFIDRDSRSGDTGEVSHLWVRAISADGPADRAGVREGDQITQIQGIVVDRVGAEVASELVSSSRIQAGESVELVVERGKRLTVTVVAEPDPEGPRGR